MNRAVFLCVMLFLVIESGSLYLLSGQEADILQNLEILDNPELADDAEWLERLWELRESPLNLNKVTLSDLLQIPFLNRISARIILKYREEHKLFSDSRELFDIQGLPEETATAIMPFVTAKPVSPPNSYIYRLQTRREYPLRSGYRNNIYQNPYYVQQRFLFQSEYNISGGIIWEKDAGEPDYFDYGSFYLQYVNPTGKFSLLIGDYYQKIGTGLISWSPYGSPLSVQGLNSFRSEVTGNRSSSETGFYRGLSVSCPLIASLRMNAFYSRNRFDGTIDKKSGEISGLYVSGLHRNETEKSKKHILSEQMTGVSFSAGWPVLTFEIATMNFNYQPGIRDIGLHNSYSTMSAHVITEDMESVTELALQNLKTPAFFHYSSYHEPGMRWEMCAYWFHPGYSTLHGRTLGGFQEEPSNRAGSAIICQLKPFQLIRLAASVHYYRPNYDSRANPFITRDYSTQVDIQLKEQVFRLNWSRKYRPLTIGKEFRQSDGLRLSHDVTIAKMVRIINRLDLRWTNPLETSKTDYGMNYYQQIEFAGRIWKFYARWSVFDVPDYQLKIYEFETDLPGSIRSVMLNGNGYKFFAMLRFTWIKYFQLDIKYQQRAYPEQESIGSGWDTISSSRMHEFRISIIWKK